MRNCILIVQVLISSYSSAQSNDLYFFPILKLTEAKQEDRIKFDSAVIDSFTIGNYSIRYINTNASSKGAFRSSTSFGTYTIDSDTVIVDNYIYVVFNSFPDLFHYEGVVDDADSYKDSSYMGPINPPNSGFIGGEPHITFYNNGNLESICIFNSSDGAVKIFFSIDGKLIKQGAYRNNQKNGPWIYFDKEGKIIKRESYKNGVIFHQEG